MNEHMESAGMGGWFYVLVLLTFGTMEADIGLAPRCLSTSRCPSGIPQPAQSTEWETFLCPKPDFCIFKAHGIM